VQRLTKSNFTVVWLMKFFSVTSSTGEGIMNRFLRWCIALVAFMAMGAPAMAQVDRSPNFGTTVPAGWVVDRYSPQVFGLVNGFNGRNDVLQIGVNSSGSTTNRPSGFSSSFYATQGMKYGIDPSGVSSPASQYVTFDLWLESTWNTNAGGNISTGMWTRLNQVNSNAEGTAYYPILNFTNESGAGVVRYWNSTLGYQTTAALLNYGAWNNFQFEFNGNSVTARVNGSVVATELLAGGTTRLTNVYMQARNYDNNPAYNAYWSNAVQSTVPEPSTYLLMASGLAGIGIVARHRRKVK
jgi:hypothetical protein